MNTLNRETNQSSQTSPATPATEPTIEELRTQREQLRAQLFGIDNRLKPIERRERLVGLALLEQVYGGGRHNIEIKVRYTSDGKAISHDAGIVIDEPAPVHLSINPRFSRAEACGCLREIIANIESEIGEAKWKEAAERADAVLRDAGLSDLVFDETVPF